MRCPTLTLVLWQCSAFVVLFGSPILHTLVPSLRGWAPAVLGGVAIAANLLIMFWPIKEGRQG